VSDRYSCYFSIGGPIPASLQGKLEIALESFFPTVDSPPVRLVEGNILELWYWWVWLLALIPMAKVALTAGAA